MNQKKEDAVLVISTGGQDLKVVCAEKAGRRKSIVLRKMDGDSIRALHEALASGDVPFLMVSDEDEIRTALPDLEADVRFNLDTNSFSRIRPVRHPSAEDAFEPDCFNGKIVEALQDAKGRWLLYPAKLDSIVQGVRTHFDVKGALVFYSDRKSPESVDDGHKKKDLERHYNREPVATGKLIAQWLAPGVEDASKTEGAHYEKYPFCYFNYLKGQIAMEGDKTMLDGLFSPYDQPLALPVVVKMTEALQALRARFPNAVAIVSHTGGPGDVKNILTPATRLYFGGNIIELHASEFVRDITRDLNDPAHYRIPARNAVLDARHHAALRLWEGDFAGAWAVVSHIGKNDPGLPCDSWVKKIHDAASFMQGWAEPQTLKPFVRLPEGRGLEKLFILAWRVEAALQNNDGKSLITDALRHMGTFREKLLEYLLLVVLNEHEDGASISIDLSNWEIHVDDKAIRNNFKYKRKCKKVFVDGSSKPLKSRDVFYIKINKKDKCFGVNSIQSLEEYFENEYGSVEYWEKYVLFRNIYERDIAKECLDISSGNRQCLRGYRNQLTHSILPPDDIEKITQFGREKGLWNTAANYQNRDNLGTCFLAMPVIADIFKLISPGCSPAEEYRRFVGGLLDAIFEPMRKGCAP